MTVRESFVGRVRALRESWLERRQIARFATARDLQSQHELLLTLHSWAADAVTDVRAVYGESFAVELTPPPAVPEVAAGFTVAVKGEHAVTFALAERRRLAGSRWHVAVTVREPGSVGITQAGPERRNGQWTRGRLEDLVLSILGAYERSVSAALDDADVEAAGERTDGSRLAIERGA